MERIPDWTERPVKQLVRDRLLLEAKAHLGSSPIRYIGLPGEALVFEKELVQAFDVSSMLLFERNVQVYGKIQEALVEFSAPCTVLNTEVEALGLDPTPYIEGYAPNFVWYDFMGCLTEDRMALIERTSAALDNEGFLAITIARREVSKIKDHLLSAVEEDCGCTYLTTSDEVRCLSFIAALRKGKPGSYRVHAIPYSETRCGMLLLMATRQSGGKSGYYVEPLITRRSCDC